LTERAGECGFTSAPRADDRHALHLFNVVSVARLNI
jgi:hypothetical protein